MSLDSSNFSCDWFAIKVSASYSSSLDGQASKLRYFSISLLDCGVVAIDRSVGRVGPLCVCLSSCVGVGVCVFITPLSIT